MLHRVTTIGLAVCLFLLAAGCGDKGKDGDKGLSASEKLEKKITEEREKLSAEDRALVAAQNYCPIMTEQRLGGMGPPVRVTLKDKPVFLCCKGCKKAAEDDPEGTLKVVADLKAKNK